MTLALPLASVNKPLYAPSKMAAVAATLASEGVPVERVLQGSGLNAAMLPDAQTRASVRQYVRVCRNALELSPNPMLGSRIGARNLYDQARVYTDRAKSTDT